MEIKKSKKPIKYHDAIRIMEKRLHNINKGVADELVWILEHEEIYTAGKNHKDSEIIDKSIKIFDVYCKYYGLTTAEEIARCWNGGPRGMSNPVTANYWKKVKKSLDS